MLGPPKSIRVDRLGRYLVVGHRLDKKRAVLRWSGGLGGGGFQAAVTADFARRSEGSADFVTWTHMCEPFARQISTERVSGMINQAKAAPFAVHPHILARKVARRSVADLHSINKFWHDMPHNGIIREADEVVARDPGRVRRAAGSVLQEESRARIEGLTSPILLDPSEQLISNDRVSLPGAREFIAGEQYAASPGEALPFMDIMLADTAIYLWHNCMYEEDLKRG